jgi:DNA-directed RNA polymerase subunit omega
LKEEKDMSVVEPNVLELLEHAESRYTLVVEASKRGRQIVAGSQPLIDAHDMKPLKVAVEEINRDLITYDNPVMDEEQTEQ